MLVHWIWFAQLALADHWKTALLEHFHDPEDVYFSDSAAMTALGLPPEAAEALKERDLTRAEEILEECGRLRVGILTYRDGAYPNRLRNIPDPPMVLYYQGCLPDFDRTAAIAVVGTRNCTAYGVGTAKRMGYQIAKCGGLVVSGVAEGIDGMAMRGALSAGKPVVGVLGCGVDVVYPKNNRDLYEDLRSTGCLLTEYPPGTPPVGWRFPRRNRILSGICCGVVVVEAPEKSGALITARRAADQGRDVFVVPGNIDVPSCAGSNALLREGAIAVSSGWDVVSEYENRYPVTKYTGGNRQTGYADEIPKPEQTGRVKVAQKAESPVPKPGKNEKGNKKDIDNGKNIPYSDWNDRISFLSETERNIVRILESGEAPVDEVIAGCEGQPGAVLAALTLLEIKGIVKRLPGKRVKLGDR